MKFSRLLFISFLFLIIGKPVNAQNDTGFNVKEHYNKQEVVITMRDGIKLHTTIYSPKDTSKKVSYPHVPDPVQLPTLWGR
jgi:uncharacterized protein